MNALIINYLVDFYMLDLVNSINNIIRCLSICSWICWIQLSIIAAHFYLAYQYNLVLKLDNLVVIIWFTYNR